MLRHLPNIITIFRLVLLGPFVYFSLRGEYHTALYLFFIAGVSDGLDGLLARRFNWGSRLGAMLDPAADKLLMLSGFSVMTWMGFLPLWVFIVMVARDLIIVMGVGIVYFKKGHIKFKPIFISKLNTFLQVFLVCNLLFQAAFELLSPVYLYWLIHLVVFTTVWSVIQYMFQGFRMLKDSAYHE